jgi:Bacteriophage tail sheath protein
MADYVAMADTPVIPKSNAPPVIARAPTSVALFVGWTPRGQSGHPVGNADFLDYERFFGDDPRSLVGYAVRHFFSNGGRTAFVVRIVGADGGFIAPTDPAFVAALNAAFANGAAFAEFDPSFNLICVPGLTDAAAIVMLQALATTRRAFLIADCEETATVASVSAFAGTIDGVNAANSALYFPWVMAQDPLQGNTPRAFPPSGAVAGIYARIDAKRAVWKAPAGEDAALSDVTGLSVLIDDASASSLDKLGVDCLRQFPTTGVVPWGARTLAGNEAQASEWKYVNVRRLMLFIEQSIDAGTKWVAFEPNGEPLWAKLRVSIETFMQGLFNDGAFQGVTPSDAFFVTCDATTTTQADIDNGVVNIVIGFAPLYPAEFVIIKISQFTASN